jgi:hypothetical protein
LRLELVISAAAVRKSPFWISGDSENPQAAFVEIGTRKARVLLGFGLNDPMTREDDCCGSAGVGGRPAASDSKRIADNTHP